MRKEVSKKLFSILFLTIFFSKMVISVAPLIIAHFNKEAVNSVIMQLEIENNSKNDIKENTVKEYFISGNFGFKLPHPLELILTSMLNQDHDKHIQAFYPPVPTPPPNV